MNTNQSGEYPSQHSPEPTINVEVDAQRTLGPNREDTQKPNLNSEGELRADSTHQTRDGLNSLSGQATNHLSSQSTHRTPTPHQSAMVFRVECPGSPPQRLQLTGEIYTLGAGEGCSIRLRDPNVLPLHVTLCHQADTVVIRAHQEPVWVNGQAVGKSEIKIGDVITLGGYRFQLMSKQFTSIDKHEKTRITNVLPPEVERAIAESSDSNTTSATTSSVTPNSSDEQSLENTLIQNRIDACLRREQLCEKREEKLSHDQAELKIREEDIARRVAILAAEETSSLELYDQLSERQAEINKLRSTLESYQESHLAQEKHFEESRNALEEKLTLQLGELQSCDERQTIAEAEIKDLTAKLEGLSKELNHAQQQRDLIELRERLQRREHEHVVRQLENDRDHVIAEKAENQAKLRRMEGSIRELETLVASVDEVASDNDEIDLSLEAEEDFAEEILTGNPSEFFDESFEPSEEILETATQDHQSPEEVELESATEVDASFTHEPNPECYDDSGTFDQLDSEALAEFAELSQKNSELLTELIRIKRERDDAKREAADRKSVEEVSELEAALSLASSELAKTRADYDEAISLLGKMKKQREREKIQQQREEQAPRNDSDDDSDLGSPDPASTAESHSLNSETEGMPKSASRVSSAWKSLLKNLGQSKGSDPNPIAIEESSTETHLVIAEEADATLESEMMDNDTGDSWFHSCHSSKEERIDQGTDQKETLRRADEGMLFVSKSQVAIQKPQRVTQEELNQSEDALWHGSGREQLTASSHPSDRENSLPQPTQIVGSTIDLMYESSVEESVDRLLEKADQNRVNVEASEESSSSYLADESSRSVGATSQIISTIRSLFPSSIEKTSRINLADQEVPMRYAFAFGAITAGFVCYRLVPGQVRYLAVLVSMVLAAIYISEGVNMTRSRTSR